MASEIQVARGSLAARDPNTLLDAELFWVPENISNDAEKGYRRRTDIPFDRGTLYIGRPSSLIPSEHLSDITPMPIAGERSYKGMVYRGQITSEKGIVDENGNIYKTFKYVREGDFFVFSNWAAPGGQFEKDRFKDGDILLITRASYKIAPDLSKNIGNVNAEDIDYIKINAFVGEARNIDYAPVDGLPANNVQDALTQLNNTKISYKGTIPDDFHIDSLMTQTGNTYSGRADKLIPGAMYLVLDSGYEIKGTNLKGNATKWTTTRGDFIIWQDDERGWLLVPSGFNSKKLEFDPTEAVKQQTEIGTFNEDELEHIISTSGLTNVQDALTYLLSHKAMLDSSGKVPLSQLHSTVLGAMQYKGTWDPVKAGLSLDNSVAQDINNQNPWPTATNEKPDVAGDEESPLNSGARKNKPGDYYIVSTSYKHINYIDKDSITSTGVYSREPLVLNNGDWIVYTDIGNGKGRWEVIDNTDKLSGINFTVNGTKVGGAIEYLSPTHNTMLIDIPTHAADGKLVIYENGSVMTTAGVRLVDQAKETSKNPSQTYHLPVYTDDANDTITVSTIKNFQNALGINVTETHSDVVIGSETEHYNEYIYGDIFINPHIFIEDGLLSGPKDSGVVFNVTSGKASTLYADPKQKDGQEFILPTLNSKIIGKLKGITLIGGRLTKSIQDGYIESTSIEEHMRSGNTTYNDDDILSVEFHAPVVDVNNIETRHIKFGRRSNLNNSLSNGGQFGADGRLLEGELTADVYAHSSQSTNVTHTLPQQSGVLVNDTDWKKNIVGTEGTIPVYGTPDQRDNEASPRTTLIDSKVKQLGGALFDLLFNSKTDIHNATHTIDGEKGLDSIDYRDYTDERYNNEKHGVKVVDPETGAESYVGTDSNVIFESDTVIGEIEKTDNGYKVKTPRSLMVTKSLLVGNQDTNTTQIIPGRKLFPRDTQYFDPRTDELLPEKDVYVEMPSVSGVLLTSNSRIDGGLYVI